MDDNGWDQSAEAWITQMGEHGDEGRRHLLDPAMLARIEVGSYRSMLDIGCGEGRLCRLLQARGINTTGIDPTQSLIERARALDPDGTYHLAKAEDLPFADDTYDLVVTCLTLIDIAGYREAIAEMARVLAPGGTLLAANLTGLQSAGAHGGWQAGPDGKASHFLIEDYGSEWSAWVEWSGIRIQNWHRPLSAYMQAFLASGLTLTFFDELTDGPGLDDPDRKNARVPWFNIMEWRKP